MKRLAALLAATVMLIPAATLSDSPNRYPGWVCQLMPILCSPN